MQLQRTLYPVGFALAVLSACSSAVAVPDTARDAGSEASASETGRPTSFAFLVSALGFEAASGRTVVGLDVDGTVSTGGSACHEREDFVSPSGTPGVDNQFSTLLPQLEAGVLDGHRLHDVMQGDIASGDFIVLLELTGVDNLRRDDEVIVHVYRYMLSAQDRAAYRSEVTAGLPHPGIAFARIEPVATSSVASIVAGQVSATFMTTIPLASASLPFALNLRSARFEARIMETAIGPNLDQAVLGASLNVAETVRAFAPDVRSWVESQMLQAADTTPIAGPPPTCATLSFGTAISAVSAEIAP